MTQYFLYVNMTNDVLQRKVGLSYEERLQQISGRKRVSRNQYLSKVKLLTYVGIIRSYGTKIREKLRQAMPMMMNRTTLKTNISFQK